MLQAFLTIAVPTLVTVLYYLHRVATQEQNTHRPSPSFNQRPGFGSGRDTADNRRLTTYPTPRDRPNSSRGPAGGSTETSRRTGSSTASSPHNETCVVCSEAGRIVELYPCLHRSLCEDCASRMMQWEERNCPCCSKRIHGFI